MGGFKNELIASQLEVSERVPEPVPARNHVALRYGVVSPSDGVVSPSDRGHNAYGYPKRSALRKTREVTRDIMRYGEQAFIIGMLTGLVTGMIIMLVIRFSEVVG